MSKPTPKTARELIETAAVEQVRAKAQAKADRLEAEVSRLQYELRSKDAYLEIVKESVARVDRMLTSRARKLVPLPRQKATKHLTRVVIPDSHGNHIDPIARDAFLRDLGILAPDEVVGLGDHTDCGGTFNAHQITYTNEMTESYEDDANAANLFFNACVERAPNARWRVLEGNHEAHVERWCARNVKTRKDAEFLLKHFSPEAILKYKERGFEYFKSKDFHMGLSVRGTIKLGKCYFTHGISHSKHADDAHLAAFNGNVVFGHVHRVLEVRTRTVSSQGHGAWSPGTLAKMQPLYRHTEPTTWSHGYGLQFVSAATGRFTHINVPIFADGSTGLQQLTNSLGAARTK